MVPVKESLLPYLCVAIHCNVTSIFIGEPVYQPKIRLYDTKENIWKVHGKYMMISDMQLLLIIVVELGTTSMFTK